MESFFKKYGWIVHLVIIALISALLGVAVNQVVAIRLAPFTVPELADLSKSETDRTQRAKRSDKNLKRTIIQRCLFGCTEEAKNDECPEGCGEGEVCQSGVCVVLDTSSGDSEDMVLSDLKAKLQGCMVARKPEYSLALMNEEGGKQTFIVGVGDQLMGEAEVLEIRRDRIIIRRNGRREYIRLANSIGGSPAKVGGSSQTSPKIGRAPKTPPSIKKSNARANAASKKGVKKTGNNTYEIDRKSIEEQLSDPKKLAKQARIVPNYKNGKPNGIKLVGVSPNSVYAKIGIKSGDAIIAIDGKKITSQARALQLLEGMRGSSGAKIDIERGGKRQSLSYTVK